MPYSQNVQDFLKRSQISIGDEVEFTVGHRKFKGFLLPREETDFGNPDVLLIKLPNGYNIGFELSKIEGLRRLSGKTEFERFPSLETREQRKDLPPITILSTGGTISARVDYVTGGVAMLFSPEEILFGVPELGDIVRIRKAERIFSLASEDLAPSQWAQVASKVIASLSEGDAGVIVLHGTDTMHFTSAALSFMIRGLNAPVILTGAQRSPDRGSRDADLNLLASAYAASKLPCSIVAICFHGSSSDDYALVLRGTKVRKMHTSVRNAFRPINDLPVARIFKDGRLEMLQQAVKPRAQENPWLDGSFEEKTAMLYAYPNSNPELLDFLLDKGYRGFIILGSGLGHVPTQTVDEKASWLKSIERALAEGAFVGMASQCIYGRVDPYVYRNARIILKLGVVYLEDMLAETAYVKLGWLLGHNFALEDVRRLMLHNFAGELGGRENAKTFLF